MGVRQNIWGNLPVVIVPLLTKYKIYYSGNTFAYVDTCFPYVSVFASDISVKLDSLTKKL